jgi:heme o synthase
VNSSTLETPNLAISVVTQSSKKSLGAWIELMKLRMVLHILITAFVGFYFGAGVEFPWTTLAWTLAGTGLLAIAAFAFNQTIEKHADAKMERTRNRPIPTSRVGVQSAWIFGSAVTLLGSAILLKANLLTAILGLSTVILYAAVYTPMKRWSSLNTLVGAIPGALPPLMGWTASHGSFGLGGWLIFAILFSWQLPHFLAIAMMYQKDYASGGFQMLSVTDPSGAACSRHILFQTMVLCLVSLFPFLFRLAGPIYLLSALVLGGFFLVYAIKLFKSRERSDAVKVFLVSLAYLPILLLALAYDKTIIFV